MQIIKQNVEELVQGLGFDGMMKHIEVCGRTCYKSNDRITGGSAEKFVNMLREHAHGAMLEHGTIYLTIYIDVKDITTSAYKDSIVNIFEGNKYTKVTYGRIPGEGTYYYITTNYRVIVENKLEDVMKEFWSEPTKYHEKRRTAMFITNRGVSHEFVRHRVFSFAQESQRYVNYQKDKFGKEIKVIDPTYFKEGTLKHALWLKSCEDSEATYFCLINNGATPQEAREVLPNATATTLIMTGFESDWQHFFNLRCAKDAHPQAQEAANMWREVYDRKE